MDSGVVEGGRGCDHKRAPGGPGRCGLVGWASTLCLGCGLDPRSLVGDLQEAANVSLSLPYSLFLSLKKSQAIKLCLIFIQPAPIVLAIDAQNYSLG